MSKINICAEFANKLLNKEPFRGWYQGTRLRELRHYFNSPAFNEIKFAEARAEEKNYLFLPIQPQDDLIINFFVGQEKYFYDQILQKNFKILFNNQGYALFHQHKNKKEETFNIPYIDINLHLYWKILNVLKKNNISEENIYFLHSANGYLDDIEELKHRAVAFTKSIVDIKSKHLELPLYFTWGQHLRPITVINEEIKYHYSCLFNGRPATHRQDLIKALWNKNLLSYGKYSYSRVPNTPYFIDDFRYNGGRANHTIHNWNSSVDSTESNVFKDIFLWVAGETAIPQGYPGISEKTVKPILYERPFISYGEPGILKYLKSFGFKTFRDYWDESYDDIADYDIKIKKITAIIETLCEKDLTEVNRMFNDMKPILAHNKKLFQETDWVGKISNFLK